MSKHIGLVEAIEKMYLAFSDIEKPSTMHVDTPYITHEEVKKLIDTPLRELYWEILGKYEYSAPKLLGNEKDYLYFLPRLIELTVQYTYDIFRLFRKAGDIKRLTTTQSEALGSVITAYWLEELDRNPYGECGAAAAMQTIAEMSLLNLPLKDFLCLWIESDAKFVNEHLAVAVRDYWESVIHKRQVYFLLSGDIERPL